MGARIAIFDMNLVATSSAGSCALEMVRGLCQHYDFTIFASECDDVVRRSVRWESVPTPGRPAFVPFPVFRARARAAYKHASKRDGPFALVQATDTQYVGAHI